MITKSAEETKNFSRDFVLKLKKPTIIALSGELGAGKTTFTQGVAEVLNLKRRALSPTFVFWRSYKISDIRFKKLEHFDLYRCESLEDVKAIGLPEVVENIESLVLIEWPALGKAILPKDTVWINFKKISESEREITVGGLPDR